MSGWQVSVDRNRDQRAWLKSVAFPLSGHLEPSLADLPHRCTGLSKEGVGVIEVDEADLPSLITRQTRKPRHAFTDEGVGNFRHVSSWQLAICVKRPIEEGDIDFPHRLNDRPIPTVPLIDIR